MPSDRFIQATVEEHDFIGGEYYRLVLHIPLSFDAKPGQFVMLRASERHDPLLARPFGIASLPTVSSVEIIYRVVGKGTELLTKRRCGETITMLGPIGNGFPLPEPQTVPILISGGSGFPPIRYLSLTTAKTAKVFLGAATATCAPPAAMLSSFREQSSEVILATDDGSLGHHGVITESLDAYLRSAQTHVRHILYACGPHGMLSAVSRLAEQHSVTCYVSMEERMACGLGACMGCSVPQRAGGYKRACKEGPVFDSRDIDWNDRIVLPIPHRKQ